MHVHGPRQIGEQRAVHRHCPAAPHLVPEVAGKLELGLHRHLDLRQRDEVVESGLARDLLGEEPLHLCERRAPGEPGKERVTLPRTAIEQLVEPADECVRVAGHAAGQRLHRCALFLDEPGLQCPQAWGVLGVTDSIGEARLQAVAGELHQGGMELCRVHAPLTMRPGRRRCIGYYVFTASSPTTAMRSTSAYAGRSSSSPKTSGSSSAYSCRMPRSTGASCAHSTCWPSITGVAV